MKPERRVRLFLWTSLNRMRPLRPARPNFKAAETHEGFLKPISWLLAILTSVGAVGLLTGFGYVVQNARDSLLGVNLSSTHATADYVTLGGQFVLDSITATWIHWRISLAGVTLIVLAGVAAAYALYRPKSSWIQIAVWVLGFVTVTGLYVAKSWWLDLPYIRMTDLLEKPPVCETVGDASRREHDIWERFVCSRDDDTLHAALKAKAGVDCAKVPGHSIAQTDNLQDLRVKSTSTASRTVPTITSVTKAFQRRVHSDLTIEQEYTLDIFASALVAYIALGLYLAPFLKTVSIVTASLLRVLLVAIVFVDVATLPMVYGKVMLSTRCPYGRIIYEGIVARGKTIKVGPRNKTCLLVGSDEKFVTFYDDSADANAFIQVRRDKVYSIAVEGTADLVGTRINFLLQNSSCGGTNANASPGVVGSDLTSKPK